MSKRYEYRIEPQISDQDEEQNWLNELGSAGWELVAIMQYQWSKDWYYFKRELP